MATGERTRKSGGVREMEFREKVAQNLKDNRPMFVRFLRCTECLPHVTGVIEGFDSAFGSKLRQTANNAGQEEANELFLQKLEDCKDHLGKWKTLINTLSFLEYEMLVKLLTGNPVNQNREHYVKLVELLTPVIINKLNPIELLDHLVEQSCINKRDKENVECAVRQKGAIEGTELLLSRVTRLRDDWFRGLMVSLMRTDKIQLMKEIDSDFTAKLLADSEVGNDSSTDLSTRLSPLDISTGSLEGDADSSAAETPDVTFPSTNEATAFPMKEGSPTVLFPSKELELLPYQKELLSSVPEDKNTLILAPKSCGKDFVALKLIKDRLSNGSSRSCKILYLVAETKALEQIRRRCREYVGCRPAASVPLCQQTHMAVLRGEDFHRALKEKSVSFEDFSLVILELDAHYFGKQHHIYKRIMPFYLKSRPHPGTQIVVLSWSLCGMPPLQDLYCIALETCAQFDIEVTSTVKENIQSLREHISMPTVERISFSDRNDGGFSQAVEELMSRVESAMQRKHHSLVLPNDEVVKKMSEIPNPPTGRTSLKYRTWLITNKTTLWETYKFKGCDVAIFFRHCLNLLQLYQNALYISDEFRTVDALDFLKLKIKDQHTNQIKQDQQLFKTLIEDFEEKALTLLETCSIGNDSPLVQALEEKLADIYRKDRSKWVAVLIKHPQTGYSLLQYLRHSKLLKGIRIQGAWKHGKETTRLSHLDFQILITTWPVLSFHLRWAWFGWHCIIRTDCPGYLMVTWQNQAHESRLSRSQFSLRGRSAEEEMPLELFLEASIETVTMEILRLQVEATDQYQESIRNIHTANEQREAFSVSNPEIEEPFPETDFEFVCHDCGIFVCNHTYIRKLDDLSLGLDRNLIHRVVTVKHPAQLVFNRGFSKLGRIVCKNCGQKWGIVVYVLRKPHFAFAKEGLDLLIKGELVCFNPSWKYTGVALHSFDYERDLLRCLPSTFCVERETITDLLERLPRPGE